MVSYTEVENLKAEAESIEEDLSLLIDIYDDGRLDPQGGVEWLNSVIDRYNELAENVAETVGVQSSPHQVEYPQQYNESSLVMVVNNINKGCNHAKRVLSGYERDLEMDKSHDGMNVPQRGHDEWNRLRKIYRKKISAEQDNQAVLNPKLRRIMHVSKKSQIFHSVVHHLTSNRTKYAKSPDFGFSVLEASALQGAYSVREGIFNLVNQIWELEVETGPENGKWRSEVINSDIPNEVEDVLNSLLSGSSTFGSFLTEYRHPDVHDETLSKVTDEDLAMAISGDSRPYIEEFITDADEVSKNLELKEKTIIDNCSTQFDEEGE